VSRRPPTTSSAITDAEALARRVQAVEGRDLAVPGPEARPWGELAVTRRRIWTTLPCVWPDHRWVRFEFRGTTIALLCDACGTTPLEAMARLPTSG